MIHTNILDTIDMRELGKELQNARSRRGMTQEQAAKIIDVSRTTITAIEKGERRIKADELIALAGAYGCQVSDFVHSVPKFEPFQPQFRNLPAQAGDDMPTVAAYIDEFEKLCRNYLELEQITSSPLIRKYPPEYATGSLSMAQAAESVALEERNRLGLGEGPIPLLRETLEQDVGLRIFYLSLLPMKISAIYIYSDKTGGCIAINSFYPEERRRWSLARIYAHFLIDRYKPTVFIEESYQRQPEHERFVHYFALYFLMPASGLSRRFNDLRRTKGKVTPADLSTLAHYYSISLAAMTLRLEDMKLLPTGIWNALKAGGGKVHEAQQQYKFDATHNQAEKLPIRYQYLAVDAFDRALISEGQFASFLDVDRLEARHLAELLRQQTSDVNGSTTIELDMTQTLGA